MYNFVQGMTVKVDKCYKNKYDAISRKLSKAQENVRGILKAEFMKLIFHVSINYFKLWFQLRYYPMNNNVQNVTSFILTLTRDTVSKTGLLEATSGPLKLRKYAMSQ